MARLTKGVTSDQDEYSQVLFRLDESEKYSF